MKNLFYFLKKFSMKEIIINSINCKIGSSAKENWLLLDQAKEYHIFFHLSSFPSCYVILECEQNYIKNDDDLNQCAEICKNNTKYKNLNNLKVDYTLCNNIIKGTKIGEIYYKSNRQVKQIKIKGGSPLEHILTYSAEPFI